MSSRSNSRQASPSTDYTDKDSNSDETLLEQTALEQRINTEIDEIDAKLIQLESELKQ